MSLKNRIIDDIIKAEGGYINDPNDSGGETNFGITERTARAHGYTGNMVEMPRSFAESVYSKIYWDSVAGDALLIRSESLAAEVVDTGVNMGPKRAIIFLQRCLNALNDRGQLYKDLATDGIIGPALSAPSTHT